LGIGPNPQSPIPNPQSPIPNDKINYFKIKLYLFQIIEKIINKLKKIKKVKIIKIQLKKRNKK